MSTGPEGLILNSLFDLRELNHKSYGLGDLSKLHVIWGLDI